MKLKYLILPSLLFLFSCGSDSDSSESSSSDHSSSDDTETTEEVVEEETSDAALFAANESVTRYDNDMVPSFETYKYNEVLEYVFPEAPEFDVNSDYGPTNSRASALFEGTIYAIKISDYTDTGDNVDDGFLEHICHDSEYELLGASNITKEQIQNANGVSGWYSTYTYDMDDKTYSEDLITLGVGQVVVYFNITSRPNFESKAKLEYMVNSVKAL